jgi:hypothetical protein
MLYRYVRRAHGRLRDGGCRNLRDGCRAY